MSGGAHSRAESVSRGGLPSRKQVVRYAELHCHSAYSFRDGASLPSELAAAAAEHGYEALAVCDHDGIYGVLEVAFALRGVGIKPIAGAELTLTDGHHVTLLCRDRRGWSNLCRLVTRAHERTRRWSRCGERPWRARLGRSRPPLDPADDEPAVTLEEVERHAEGLICLSGCARSGAVAGRIERGDLATARAVAERLLAAFGHEGFWIELQRPLWRHDRRRNRLLAELAERLRVRTVATGNVHAHSSRRARLQDALVAARLRRALDECEPERRGNHAHVVVPPSELARRFKDHSRALAESVELAERIAFDPTRDLGYSYPGSDDPDACTRLAELCWSRFERRYPPGHRHRREAQQRLAEELRVIARLGLCGFFLLHNEILELAREVALELRGREGARSLLAPGRGRGSSVSSIVCYLTGLSHIDPVANGLVLGRFLNEQLTRLPDIDLDFPRDLRDLLIERVHRRYGSERAALVCSFPTYQVRSAVRDLGLALGLPRADLERLARALEPWRERNRIAADVEELLGERARQPRWRALVELVEEAHGLPRHVAQHPGGMVIATRPLTDLCALQPAAMQGRWMVQWDKDSCADAGFLKIDLLGLGMLSAVERCVAEIERVRGERIDLSRIPYDDAPTWRSIQRAETVGVFQIESRAQMQMLRRTRPQSLADLTVQVALVRPGPIQGGAVHPYLQRRERLRTDPRYRPRYEHPALEQALGDTLGAIVFQDQVLEVARLLAGFTHSEAEGLRRSMSRRRSRAALDLYRRRFVDGALARGVPRELAERMWRQIVGFSGYGFPKAHAAAFALLAYQSAWLRVHYAPEFLCALLNEQPMGFYPPDSLVREARRRGVAVKGPCVLRSDLRCKVEPAATSDSAAASEGLAVRIGLGYIAGAPLAELEALLAEREAGGPYRSLADLAARCGCSRQTLELLALAGACDALLPDVAPAARRRRALWELGVAAGSGASRGRAMRDRGTRAPRRRSTIGRQPALPLEGLAAPRLPDLERWQEMLADYRTIGLSLAAHPLALMREGLPAGVLSSRELEEQPEGAVVRCAGLVVIRQRPATARGVTFVLLEDEHGTINLVVPPPLYQRRRLIVRCEPLLLAIGRVEHRTGTTHVVCDDVERLVLEPPTPRRARLLEPARAWSGAPPRSSDLPAAASRRAARASWR